MNSKVAIAYCFPLDDLHTFFPCAERWAKTFLAHPPGYPHDVHIVFCNGTVRKKHLSVFDGIEFTRHEFRGKGWDIGTYQYISKQLTAYSLVVFMNARSFFWRSGWLKRLMEARSQHFDPNGLYGPSASYEKCPWKDARNFLGPHIRTACFATNPNTFNRYPYLIDSRDKGFLFESGEWNMSNWYADNGYTVLMVTWDGVYERPDWRKPANVFRKGDQSNLLVRDRHTEMFATASLELRTKLTRCADGLNFF